MKIGFIGTGIMGMPMAKNLLASGLSLTVLERRTGSADQLVAKGAQTARTPREVAEQSDVVLTMLPDSPQVRDVALGADGIIDAGRDGLVYVDMSSIDPAVTREVSEKMHETGAVMIDAPVSGGEPKAIDGTLSFMVGGPVEAVEAVEPILRVMGSSVVRVGEIGAGNVAKLANQAIVATNIAVVAEALVMAQKCGVDPESVFHAIKGGLAGSTVMDAKAPMMLRHDFSPGFRVELHLKDLRNTMSAAHEVGSPMPLTAVAFELMNHLHARGHLADDHSALLRVYETLAGIEIAPGELA